jgi:hypothetical protein
MARNDSFTFEEFSLDVGKGVHDFSTDTIKVGLVTNGVTPAASDATPRWADYSGSEVSGGTEYAAGGKALTGVTFAEADGTATLDDTVNVTWAYDASGPTNIYHAIVYNDSASNKEAIKAIDLGGPVSLQDGALSITWNASGLLTVAVTA